MKLRNRLNYRLIVTYSLIALNIGYYLWMLFRYGSTTDPIALLAAGAQYRPLVIQGQWWRLISASFIHIGFEHLLINMLSLYFLGSDLEIIVGSGRFLLIYLISCVGGNALSFAFNTSISAGASTGIFGLLLCFVVLSRLTPESYQLRALSQNYLLLLVMNLFMSLFSSGIDLYGHLGGAIFGGLASFMLYPVNRPPVTGLRKLGVLILATLLLLACLLIGRANALVI